MSSVQCTIRHSSTAHAWWMNDLMNSLLINIYTHTWLAHFSVTLLSLSWHGNVLLLLCYYLLFFSHIFTNHFFLYSLPILHSTCAHRSSTSIRWNEFNLYKNSIYWANHECEEDEKITVNDAEELNEEYWPFGFGRVVYQQWMRLSQHSCKPRIKILIYGIVH